MFDYTKATPREAAINKAAYEAGLNGTPFVFENIDLKAPLSTWPPGEWKAYNSGLAYGEQRAHNIKMGWAEPAKT